MNRKTLEAKMMIEAQKQLGWIRSVKGVTPANAEAYEAGYNEAWRKVLALVFESQDAAYIAKQAAAAKKDERRIKVRIGE